MSRIPFQQPFDPQQQPNPERQTPQAGNPLNQVNMTDPTVQAMSAPMPGMSVAELDQRREGRKDKLRGILGEFILNFASGMQASAQAAPGQRGAAGFAGAALAPFQRRIEEEELDYQRSQRMLNEARAQSEVESLQRTPVQLPNGTIVYVPYEDAAALISRGVGAEATTGAAETRADASVKTAEIGAQSREQVARINSDSRYKIADANARNRIEVAEMVAQNRMDVAGLNAENRLAVAEIQGRYGLERANAVLDREMQMALGGFTGAYGPIIDTLVEQLNTKQIRLQDVPSDFRTGVMMAMNSRGLAIIPDDMQDKMTQFSAAGAVLDSVKISMDDFEASQGLAEGGFALYRLITEANAGARKVGRAMGEVGVFTDQDKADYAALIGPTGALGVGITLVEPQIIREWLEKTNAILERVQEREFGDFFSRYDTGTIGQPGTRSTPTQEPGDDVEFDFVPGQGLVPRGGNGAN